MHHSRHRLALGLLAVLAVTAGAGLPSADGALARAAGMRATLDEGALTVTQAPRSSVVPRARDGSIAIQEELDAARQAGTREAYDLFIARHPDHPLATTARQERDRLQ